MKKSILTLAAAATFTLIGTQAFACYWDGYWGGPMGGPMAGAQGNGKYQDFYEKTASLRQDLAGKQGEYFYTEDHYRSFRRIIESKQP